MTEADSRRFVHLFGGTRESSNIVGIAKAAAAEGYAVLPVYPGAKNPICTLTTRARKTADREARERAQARGDRHWETAEHDCGRNHAITDPKEAERVFRRLISKYPDMNIGLEVGRSRLIAIDCDTAEQVRSFAKLWAEKESAPELADAAPTVRSPGKLSPSGEWVHRDGGHFWFLIPESHDFTDSPISTSMPIGALDAKAQLMFHDALVLVPPSVRAEGPYVMASDVGPAPQWLLDELFLHVEGHRLRQERHRDLVRDGSDSIDLWSALQPWYELLLEDGWSTSGRPDKCGCPTWTRPGDWSNPKSAVAHEPGCFRWGFDDVGHGFLHLYTDNPPDFLARYVAATGKKSISKLNYIAWRDFDGDVSAAMRALGIASNAEAPMTDDEVFNAARASMEAEQQARDAARDTEGGDCAGSAGSTGSDGSFSSAGSDGSFSSADSSSESGRDGSRAEGCDSCDSGCDNCDSEDDEDDGPELSPFEKLRAEFISAADLDKIEPLAPLVEGILDLKTTTRIIGQSGHGKTLVMIDIAGHIATGRPWQGRTCTQGRVVYIVAEGAAGFTQRVRAWEFHHGVNLGDSVMVLPRPVQAANVAEWAVLVEVLRSMQPSLVVIDTQARVTVGMEENSAKDMGLFIDRADRIKVATGACVALVHHQGHSGDQGRGSSAVLGALDAEIAVSKEARGQFAVLSSKQKDREDFDPIRLSLKKVGKSAVLVTRGGEEDDSPLLRNLIDEHSTTRDRLAKLLWDHFNEGRGATKSEIKSLALTKDRGPNGKPMGKDSFYRAWSMLEGSNALTEHKSRFKLAISEAVLLGLCEASEAASYSSKIRSIQGEAMGDE